MAAWISTTLFLFFALVVVVVRSTSEDGSEEALVRCPRTICTRRCHFGNVVDARGCPTCECEEDPCQACKEASKCTLVACADDCVKPWVARCDDAICKDLIEHCVECNGSSCIRCTEKFKPNDDGTQCFEYYESVEKDSSDSKSDSDEQGPDSSDSKPDSATDEAEHLPCPMPMCARFCNFGYRKNNRGCQTCDCADNPCETKDCAPEEVCMAHMGDPICIPSAMSPAHNPMMHNMRPLMDECPMVKCSQNCEFGYVSDSRGCRTCVCKSGPCEAHQCSAGFRCRGYHLDCEEASCPVLPICNVESMCQHHREVAISANNKNYPVGYIPVCQADGAFAPRQCPNDRSSVPAKCWCVDDRGKEVAGTRKNSGQNCKNLSTTSVHITFFIEHDIDYKQIAPHMGDLKRTIHHRVSMWMMIDEELIEVQDVRNVNTRVMVKVLVLRGAATDDLPSRVYNLHARMRQHACRFRFRQHVMRVSEHDFHAEHHVGSADSHADYVSHRRYYHNGNMYFLAAGALILFLMAVVIIALRLRRRRYTVQLKQKRMNHWRKNLLENLSFQKPPPYKEMVEESEEVPAAGETATEAEPPKPDVSLA